MGVYNYIKDYFFSSNDDIYIISFPKSGNTRIRMALAKYYQLQYDLGNDISYDLVNDVLPAIGLGNVARARSVLQNMSGKKESVFIKSHLRYSVLRFFMKTNKIIYIQRPNFETVMSYYDYSKARNIIPARITFSEFLRDSKRGVRAFLNHLEEYKLATKNIIDYDQLMQNDVETIIGALKNVGFKFEESIMKQAIISTRRDKIVSLENKLDHKDYNFAAKRERDYKEYFNTSDVKYYNDVVYDSLLEAIEINK